jgi:hypothetical protein
MRVEEASLVATADAIREKIGEANPIEWVANKGFADAVAGIQAGGGKFKYGTHLVSGQSSQTIMHNLGETPNLFLWWMSDCAEGLRQEYGTGYCVGKANANEQIIAGGFLNGSSFLVKYAGYVNSITTYRYEIYPTNKDKYSRKYYNLTDSKVSSGTGCIAVGISGETINYIVAVV